MKPRLLELQAFGPYRTKETIDFSELEGNRLFLIHGETGAGKTSILDGIVFALYGESSGGERSSQQLRCDAAAPDVPTMVNFEFSLGDKRYRVTRQPKQDLAAKRGTGTVSRATEATLAEVGAAGDRPMATKPTEVNAHIKELIGFSSEQFRQVVVLPQGKFRELLSANSDKREEILRQLFQTSLYGDIERRLFEKARNVRKAQEELKVERRTILEGCQVDDLESLSALEAEVMRLQADAAEAAVMAEEARDRAAAQLKAASDQSSAQTALEEAGARAEALALDDPRIQGLRETLDASRRAEQAAAVRATLDSAEAALAQATRMRAQAEAGLLEATQKETAAKICLETEGERGAEREAAAARRAFLEGLVTAYSEWEEAQKQAVTSKGAAGAAEAALAAATSLESALGQAEQAERLCLRLEKLDTVRAELALARASETAAAQRSLKAESLSAAAALSLAAAEKTWRSGRAAALAGTLVEDEPCPVCGSKHHPQPAEPEADAVDDESLQLARLAAEVAAEAERSARAEHAQALTAVGSLEATETAQKEELGEASSLDSAAARARKGEADQEVVRLWRLLDPHGEAGAVSPGLPGVEALRERAQSELLSEQLKAATAQGAAETLGASIPEELRGAGKLHSAVSDARKTAAELEQALQAAQKLHSSAREALAAAVSADTSTKTALAAAVSGQAAALAECDSRIRELGFASLQTLCDALLDPSASQALKLEVAAHEAAKSEAQGAMTQAKAVLSGLRRAPDAPTLEECVSAEAMATEAWKCAMEERTKTQKAVEDVLVVRKRLGDVDRRQSIIEGEYQVVGLLSEVANGQLSGAKVSFQRWVLGTYLDQVLAAATRRLYEMSKGRYQLLRDDSNCDGRRPTGLDLAVFDEYSGTSRPAVTLSGGESFLAALSLALGLAETVQELAGGTRLDTIFVDEGFGALDPDALDKAMDALLELESSGRIVGVISHVPELRQFISARLEVKGGTGGSFTRFHIP